MAIFERVAGRYFAYRYARLLLAMSLGEAKQVLGFPPSYDPSTEEVTKAYKTKAFQNHPDRGGDPVKMVEINVAKDVLLGGKPSPFKPSAPPPPPSPAPPPPMEGRSLTQVMSSMPGGVDWKFRSDVAYANNLHNQPGDVPYWRVSRGWVLYGQTSSHHVFAGIRVASNQKFTSELPKTDSWEGFYTTAPRKVSLLKVAPKMVKSILDNLPDLEGYRLPKKFMVLDGTLTLADLKKRADLSLKDAILGSGAMTATEDKGLKGRKKMVTIEPIFDKDKWKKLKEQYGKVMGGVAAHAYNWVVEVNGKGRTLGEDEIDKLMKNHFMIAVYSYDYDKGKVNLTRLRGGMMSAGAVDAIRLLFEALHPGPLKNEVEEVLEQLKKVKLAAQCMPLEQVALLFDEPLHDVYRLANE
jgi:hypothetical protein